ncbi:flagellar hook-associated protein FlgK [Geodermatophilus sp. SYSU D00814]
MSSTFGGLNTASTALWAQRRALDVTGQNIANVNTDGYSRQRVDLQAMGGTAVPAVHSVDRGLTGGVSADEVLRIRDAFLEARGHTEHANQARLTAETEALRQVEQALREPGKSGIQSLLSDMWAGWDDVANSPDNTAVRGQVLERLGALVDGIRTSQTTIDAEWSRTRENLRVLVADVNSAAATIAELNQAIQRSAQSGMPVNELTDKRDLLVMDLADKVGATVQHRPDGVVDVSVGGIVLVSGAAATELTVVGTDDPAGIDPAVNPPADPPRIQTARGNLAVVPGGTAGGQLDALTRLLPRYRDALDDLAVDLATSLNAVHTTGAYDLDGAPGTPLLGSSGGPVTAASLRVLVTDPRKLAASGEPPTAGTPSLDNSVADRIAQLRLSPTGLDATYRRTVVELGVQTSVAARSLEIQGVVTTQVDAARDSVAGVNLDEEMTNMLSYQHAYSAAGRLVTTIDEMLDQLINRTGVVGR